MMAAKPVLTKEMIFESDPDMRGDKEYFTSAFPAMPNREYLGDHCHAIPFMTDSGLDHYLEFFLSYLEEFPMDSSMLFHCLQGIIRDSPHIFDESKIRRFKEIEFIRFGFLD